MMKYQRWCILKEKEKETTILKSFEFSSKELEAEKYLQVRLPPSLSLKSARGYEL